MLILEQMVETRSCKAPRGLIEDGWCRVCQGYNKMVEHLVAGCTILSNSKYLARSNSALTVLAVTWAKEHKLIGVDTVWYKGQWFWKTTRQKLSGISNSIYKKPRQQEDATWYSKQKTRSRFEFVTWNFPCNKNLIRNREISLRDISNLLFTWEKEDQDTLLWLYP